MKSGWLVRKDYCGDLTMFEVYRLLDANKPDDETNREKYNSYASHETAIFNAKRLNKQAAERYWKH